MRISDGASAVLAAIVVACLAAGLGYGAHTLLGESDSFVGPSPGTTSPAPGGDEGDLCALMDDMAAYSEGFVGSMLQYLPLFMGEMWEGQEEAWREGIHEYGAFMIDGTHQIAGYFTQAADLVTDPEVKQAFQDLAESTEEYGLREGQIAIEATSMEDYTTASADLMSDPDYLAAMDKGNVAGPIVGNYIIDVCGRDILGLGGGVDDSLKADVSSLGMVVGVYFVDWDEVTLPAITEADGAYYLNGEFAIWQSEGVVLSDQWFLDASNWCVEVASEADPTLIYSYSVYDGLTQETCASLRP